MAVGTRVRHKKYGWIGIVEGTEKDVKGNWCLVIKIDNGVKFISVFDVEVLN